jgi:flagellar motor switch protein FliN/FliY
MAEQPPLDNTIPPTPADASANPSDSDAEQTISQADLDMIEKAMAGGDISDATGGMNDAGAVASSAQGGGGSPSIDDLLKQANFDDAASVAAEAPAADAEVFKLPNFQQVMADAQVSSIDLLRDVELNVKIELGRSRMLVEDVLKLGEGSVVELDKLAGDPVDVFVNDRLVARGEVLVLNDNFCVRVNEIVAGVKEEGL